MFRQLRQTTDQYPRQFWLIFWGVFINASGASMVWPFLTIYIRQKLELPLTSVSLLLTLNSAAGLLATSIAGPAVDRFGRRGAMVVSLIVGGATRLVMSSADNLPLWAMLMAVSGAFMPLLRVGSNAMVADLVEPEHRVDAYALLRMISNLGIAIGPSIGGFITSVSYSWAFYVAAGAHTIYAMLVYFFVKESKPQISRSKTSDRDSGYGPVLRDRTFMTFSVVYTLAAMAAPLMMVLLPVYAKENYSVLERQYGFIMATNAAMVVLLQFSVTRVSKRYPALPVLTLGAFVYALGVGSVALGSGFWYFLGSMVILTFGEMLLVPTGTALTANLAPAEMRGRYMGIYSLTWGIGSGVAPVIGGLLYDHVAPVAMWYGGLVIGLLGTLGFLVLKRIIPYEHLQAEVQTSDVS